MKIQLISLFALFIGFSSCSKSEDVIDSEIPRVPMSFGSRTPESAEGEAGNTKTGEQTSSSWDTGDSFGVYSSLGTGFTTNNFWGTGATGWFMANREVTATKSGSAVTWAYDDIQYWPNDKSKKLTFVAYHPNSVTGGSVTTSPTVGANGFDVNFTVKNDKDLQEDLLYDVIKDASRIDPSGDSGTGGIGTKTQFTFEHALAKVIVNIKQAKDYANVSKIVVSSLTITSGSMFDKATFSLGANLATPTWKSSTGAAQTYELYKSAYELSTSNPTTAPYLLLIPHTPPSSNKLKIKAEYTVHYTRGGLSSGIADSYEWDVVYDWKMAYQYTYNVTIGLTGIDFAVNVDSSPWTTGTGGDVVIPSSNISAAILE